MVLMMGAANEAMPTSRKPYTAACTRGLLASMRTPNDSVMFAMVQWNLNGTRADHVVFLPMFCPPNILHDGLAEAD